MSDLPREMKISLLQFCVLLTFALCGASGTQYESKVDTLLPKLRDSLTEQDLMHWPSLLQKFPDLQYLTDNAHAFRATAIEMVRNSGGKQHITEALPLQDRASISIAAMYGLGPSEYVKFSSDVLAIGEQNPAGLQAGEISLLLFPKHYLTDLFVANYSDAKVREVLEKAKRVLILSEAPAERVQQLSKTIDDILSGAMLQWRRDERAKFPDEYPNNLKFPVLSGIDSEGAAFNSRPGRAASLEPDETVSQRLSAGDGHSSRGHTHTGDFSQAFAMWMGAGALAMAVAVLIVWSRRRR